MPNAISRGASASITWIASYPRSGNTFTRILLCNYLFGGDDRPFPINELSSRIPSENSHLLWKTLLPDLPDDTPSERQWAARHQLFERYRRLPTDVPPRALKTHTANLSVFGLPAFDLRPDDKVIYLTRHPLDVALSNADFNARDIGGTVDLMLQSGTFVTKDKLGVFDLRASWRENVVSWITATACPVLLLRYEDLRDETALCLRQVLDFLGIPVDEQRLRHAVEQSRLSSVQRQEAAEGFGEASAGSRSGRFFRSGLSGRWRDSMPDHEAFRLADGCADLMVRLGYNHPREVFAGAAPPYGPLALTS
jgi:hypothetical protein